jgi:hypothetical protein
MYSRLLWQFLDPGGYVVSENNLTASLAPNSGARETVLLFDKLDRGLPRSFPHNEQACCDALFFYKRHLPSRDGSVLLFVELKGVDVDHAINQLKNTIKHVRTAMHVECQRMKVRIGAIVITKGAAPPATDLRQHMKSFQDDLGAALWFEPESLKKERPLRGYVDKFLAPKNH